MDRSRNGRNGSSTSSEVECGLLGSKNVSSSPSCSPISSTKTSSSIMTNCEVCSSTSGLLKCAGCRKVSYCTKDHQKSHWKQHKSSCFPAVIKENDILRRHLVATKDFAQGDLIFREKPLVSGPNIVHEDLPVCLSCYNLVETGYCCSKCKWSVCSPDCEKDSKHAAFECVVLTANQVSQSKCMGNDTITILRCLLLKGRNQKTWEQLMSLESHVANRANNSNATVSLCSALAFIQQVCGLEHYDYDTIDQITGVVDINGLGSDDRLGALLYRYAVYVYWNGSMLSHSCLPNAYRIINLKSELEVYASRPIKEGEVIYTLYGESLLGTKERQRFLMDFYYFSCNCCRCSDPTEINTYFSAVKCTGEKCLGYLLPIDPLEEESLWVCTECEVTEAEDFVTSLKDGFKKEVEASGDERSLVGVMKLEAILQKHVEKTFHRNHFLIVRLEYDIAQRLSFVFYKSKPSDVPLALVEKYVNLARKILLLHDLFLPGFNRHRGRVLYFLQQGLHRLILTKGTKLRRNPGDEELQTELRNLLMELLKIRSEAIQMLSIEPDGSEESCLFQAMAANSSEIDDLKSVYLSKA